MYSRVKVYVDSSVTVVSVRKTSAGRNPNPAIAVICMDGCSLKEIMITVVFVVFRVTASTCLVARLDLNITQRQKNPGLSVTYL